MKNRVRKVYPVSWTLYTEYSINTITQFCTSYHGPWVVVVIQIFDNNHDMNNTFLVLVIVIPVFDLGKSLTRPLLPR